MLNDFTGQRTQRVTITIPDGWIRGSPITVISQSGMEFGQCYVPPDLGPGDKFTYDMPAYACLPLIAGNETNETKETNPTVNRCSKSMRSILWGSRYIFNVVFGRVQPREDDLNETTSHEEEEEMVERRWQDIVVPILPDNWMTIPEMLSVVSNNTLEEVEDDDYDDDRTLLCVCFFFCHRSHRSLFFFCSLLLFTV